MLEENGHISGGSIEYAGVDLTQFHTHDEWGHIRGKRIATIFQDPMTSLNPTMTIGKQIAETIVNHRGLDKAQAY